MFDWLFNFLNDLYQQLIDLAGEFLAWVMDAIFWIFKKGFALIMEGLGEAVYFAGDLVCVRACVDAVENIGPALSQIPDIVLYAFPYLHIQTGLELVICAYIVRFVIRRIPLIG